MTPEILASLIIKFCNVDKQSYDNVMRKRCCAEYMANCSARLPELSETALNQCKRNWNQNSEKIYEWWLREVAE